MEDLQSNVTNLCVSKSKCMAHDLYVHEPIVTDFHVVKHTHSVSVQNVIQFKIHLVAEPKDSAPLTVTK
jgi:hypothetical protein